jgi:hypothetical protein
MNMGKEKDENEVFVCPVARFFSDLEKLSGKRSGFAKHLSQSRIEFLKAIRSLVDEKIEGLENKPSKKGKKKITKIKVE